VSRLDINAGNLRLFMVIWLIFVLLMSSSVWILVLEHYRGMTVPAGASDPLYMENMQARAVLGTRPGIQLPGTEPGVLGAGFDDIGSGTGLACFPAGIQAAVARVSSDMGLFYGSGKLEASRAGSRAAAGIPERFGRQPRVAIVIDDWGYDWSAAGGFLRLDIPLTCAVLPFLPGSQHYARMLHRAGLQVMLHLPMEPENSYLNPGPGAITTGMSEDEIRHRVRTALKSVPYAEGVNNHMGSRATADRRVMNVVMDELRRHGKYFLDSYTSSHSVAVQVASSLGVDCARNNRFLDHEPDVGYVKSRLRELIRLALQNGQAIGIGHVRQETLQALREVGPEFARAGVELVYLSDMMDR